ncbi:MAG: SDR family oxidoreductase [Alphaproteobacteria bacterium]|nr:SDR family oxidoreductase [Alphaproteobacteria bacterium]
MSSVQRRGAALVTGAAKRIGRAIALDLAADGWDVAIHFHASEAEAREVVGLIGKIGRRACALRADLSREAETGTLVGRAVAALGPLTLVVNNASVFETDSWNTATRASWDEHLETNLRAPFVLTQDFARQLPEGVEGNVVNLLDQRVWSPTPAFMSYTVSKLGLWGLTQTLALALAPRIRVNGIGPGPAMANIRQTPEQFAEQCASMPLKRGTSPEEICRTLRFILSAPSMTGQMIALDGGQHLCWAPPAKGWVVPE